MKRFALCPLGSGKASESFKQESGIIRLTFLKYDSSYYYGEWIRKKKVTKGRKVARKVPW